MRYSRYVRKLKAIQYAISQGIIQLSINHLVNCGFNNVSPSNISVKFKNELINIDELEKLEFSDALTNMISNINRFFVDLNSDEATQKMLSIPSYHRFLYDTMQLLTQGYNIIKPPPEERKEPPEDPKDKDRGDGRHDDPRSSDRRFGGFGQEREDSEDGEQITDI